MKKFGKQILAFLLLGCMTLGSACGGGTETPEQPTGGNGVETEKDTPAPTQSAKPKEIVTIRYGTHYEQGLNPHYVDEVTGEYVMAENEREARLAAEQAILDELGVVFEYVQYSGDTREVLLQSVMANDPVCDIAVLWGGSEGTVLAQNVLQKIDDYAYIFQNDEECSWMLYDKLFGNYYLLGNVVRFNQRWPLVYNIDMIEAVDSLKDQTEIQFIRIHFSKKASGHGVHLRIIFQRLMHIMQVMTTSRHIGAITDSWLFRQLIQQVEQYMVQTDLKLHHRL